jgi:hypothetical protein
VAAQRGLAPQRGAVLTLRYPDDLPVPQVAALLDRTVHATEALRVRAHVTTGAALTRSPSCGGPPGGSTPARGSPRNCVPASHVGSCRPRPEDPR